MDVSVVIPSLDPPDEIEAIEHLDRGTFDDYEVLVRDEVPVTKARNAGAKDARADKLVYLDDDSRPRDDYLSRVSAALDAEDALAGRTVHPRQDIFAGDLTRHYDFGPEPRYVDRFWGCNMGIRAEVLDAVGGWDERMGWGHEEKELAARVREDYRIYYDPHAVVYHSYADSIVGYWRKQYRLEKQTPYYWDKRGVPLREQVTDTLGQLLDPRTYVRRTPRRTLVAAGGKLAKGAGRLVGFATTRLGGR
jgi:GT2 family glycosyltransferase